MKTARRFITLSDSRLREPILKKAVFNVAFACTILQAMSSNTMMDITAQIKLQREKFEDDLKRFEARLRPVWAAGFKVYICYLRSLHWKELLIRLIAVACGAATLALSVIGIVRDYKSLTSWATFSIALLAAISVLLQQIIVPESALPDDCKLCAAA
jgi:hypothetical protein